MPTAVCTRQIESGKTPTLAGQLNEKTTAHLDPFAELPMRERAISVRAKGMRRARNAGLVVSSRLHAAALGWLEKD